MSVEKVLVRFHDIELQVGLLQAALSSYMKRRDGVMGRREVVYEEGQRDSGSQ